MKSSASYRLKGKAQFLAVIVALLLVFPFRTALATYSDVPKSHPDYMAIESLTKAGIFSGYADGSFRPEQGVNRAEAAKIILIGIGIKTEPGLYATGFPDVPLDAWYAGYVMEGMLRGILGGNPDGTFAGDRGVNTAEFLKMTLLAFKTDLSRHMSLKSSVSADVPAGQWFTPHLSYAKTVGLVFPDMEYRLYPGRFLTRADCARVLYKQLVIHQGGETQKLLSIAEARLIEAMVMQNLNNITSAVGYAEEAVYYAELATAVSPGSTAVQAVNKISLAFRQLFYAYASPQNREQALSLLTEAESLAKEAVAINPTSAWLAEKISGYAATLRSQIQ